MSSLRSGVTIFTMLLRHIRIFFIGKIAVLIDTHNLNQYSQYYTYKWISLCGYWDNHNEHGKSGGELFRTFEIEQTVTELTVSLDKDYIRIASEHSRTSLAEEHSELDDFEESRKSISASDQDGDFYTSVLLSKLGTKAILLQIVPTLNIISLFFVSTGTTFINIL